MARARRHRKRRLRPWSTVQFDDTPVMYGLARVLQDARDHGARFTVTSADRRKGVPERYGKLSQAALYLGWIARRAGFNPANPPGRSTHELRSDAVAYRGPVGRPLHWWQLGIDADDAGVGDLLRTLQRLGYAVFRPYHSGSEHHHFNFRRSPLRRWKKRHGRIARRVR